MKHLRAAIQFLTRLPAGRIDEFNPRQMMAYFPLVGMILGGIVALADQLFMYLWPPYVAALLDVILLAGLTGALHIDGLGDSADGLYGQWDREKALAIMKDSRIGTMALVAIVCTLAVKWAGINAMIQHRFLFLMIIPAYARGADLFGFRFLPYGRPEGGTGHDFFSDPPTLNSFRFLAIPMVLSLFGGIRGVMLNLIFALTLWGILRYYRKKMGCITGDMLGAMVELMEAALFLTAAMGGAR